MSRIKKSIFDFWLRKVFSHSGKLFIIFNNFERIFQINFSSFASITEKIRLKKSISSGNQEKNASDKSSSFSKTFVFQYH